MTIKTSRKHHGRTIDARVSIDTTPERAWNAWADPQQIANWFVDRAEGVAKPGEVMTWFFDTFNYRLPVPVVEAEPAKTFVTGGGDQPGPQGLPYLMEITVSREAGATTIRLLNSGFGTDSKFDDEYEGVVSGWAMALATLKYWLEHHPDGRRAHHLSIEPAGYTWEALRPLFATREGRSQWLEPLMPADAPVLTETGREVLLAWPARRGVLGLKAFRMGPQAVVALDYSTWSDDAGDRQDLRPQLQQALKRLTAQLGDAS